MAKALRVVAAICLVIFAFRFGIGGLMFIVLGAAGEAKPLNEWQAIGAGLLLWALVPCLLMAAYSLVRGGTSRRRDGSERTGT